MNTATGAGTVLGESGLGTGILGLSFNAAGILYPVNYSGDVYTIDTATGAATSVGNLNQTAHHGDFDPVSGLYYRIDVTGSGPRNLVLANMSTLTFTTLTTIDNLHPLTFVDEAVTEPGTLLMLGAGLGALVLFRRKRA